MTYAPPQRKRKIRKFTWFFLAVQVLFLIWVIAGIASGSGQPSDCGGLDAQTCNDASDTGTAIGVFLVVGLWAFFDVILGIIWLVTRKRQPQVVYVQQAQVQPGWYPDQSGRSRWFDGYRWTEHVQ